MRLLGRAKLWIDTEMEPERPSSEPDATAFGKIGGFRLLDEAENSTVKGPRLGFLPGRHRQLHVIESDDLSQSLLVVRLGGITPHFAATISVRTYPGPS